MVDLTISRDGNKHIKHCVISAERRVARQLRDSDSVSPPAGCHGRHLLRPEQERPPGAGAGGLLHAGPAQGHEEDHLHRSVTFNLRPPPDSPPRPSTPSSVLRSSGTDRLLTDPGKLLTPNRNSAPSLPSLHRNGLLRLVLPWLRLEPEPFDSSPAAEAASSRDVFALDNQRRLLETERASGKKKSQYCIYFPL